MDRNLALNLARVTEAAALSAGKWLGKGDKNAADGAAVDAMRRMFDTVDIDGTVVIGEGCLLYTSPSPRDKRQSRMPSSA